MIIHQLTQALQKQIDKSNPSFTESSLEQFLKSTFRNITNKHPLEEVEITETVIKKIVDSVQRYEVRQ